MANSQYLKVRGKAYWARVFAENKDATGFDNELAAVGGQYTIAMDFDEDSILTLKTAGSQIVDYPKLTPTEDGDVTTYRVKRLHEKRSRAGDLLEWASGAPKVVKADGTPWSVEDDGFLGNGTEVELTVCVYKAGRTVGSRLEEVKVINLVPMPVTEAA